NNNIIHQHPKTRANAKATLANSTDMILNNNSSQNPRLIAIRQRPCAVTSPIHDFAPPHHHS
ncbi:hypothetical protein AAHH80_39500, partial [Burkholderia pseudomallei]